MGKTLLQLRTMVRQQADMEADQFISDAELNTYINIVGGEMHAAIALADPNTYTQVPYVYTVPSGANTIPLPADFWKLRKLEWQVQAAMYRRVLPVPLGDNDQYNSRSTLAAQLVRVYTLVRNAIWLQPEQDASGTYRLWYINAFQDLVSDSDQIDDWQGWYAFLVAGAVILCKQKGEEQSGEFVQWKEMTRQRIADEASTRDMSAPSYTINLQDGDPNPWGFPWR